MISTERKNGGAKGWPMLPVCVVLFALTGEATAQPDREVTVCQETSPRRTANLLNNRCEPDSNGRLTPCAIYSPIRSDLCENKRMRGDSLVNYRFFGTNDCRASNNGVPRRLDTITFVVIHQGGWNAQHNADTWACREAASHYSIERDGTVYQHMGEELIAPHARGRNTNGIGIELNLPREAGTSCNSLTFASGTSAAAKEIAVRAACTPSASQYTALKRLLTDISNRTSVVFDNTHIVGHCESEPNSGHGDPKAFDWQAIGLSNVTKNTMTAGTGCDWYGLYRQDTN